MARHRVLPHPPRRRSTRQAIGPQQRDRSADSRRAQPAATHPCTGQLHEWARSCAHCHRCGSARHSRRWRGVRRPFRCARGSQGLHSPLRSHRARGSRWRRVVVYRAQWQACGTTHATRGWYRGRDHCRRSIGVIGVSELQPCPDACSGALPRPKRQGPVAEQKAGWSRPAARWATARGRQWARVPGASQRRPTQR